MKNEIALPESNALLGRIYCELKLLRLADIDIKFSGSGIHCLGVAFSTGSAKMECLHENMEFSLDMPRIY